MSKRERRPTRPGNPVVKKRKGVKIRTIMVPDSDEEGSPSNVNTTDYARLVRTQVTQSGKVGSVTTSSVPLLEVEDILKNTPLPEADTDQWENAVVEDAGALTPATRKRRKKENDSVSLMSRTQVLPNDITHLCQEIRDIKRGSIQEDNIGQINKLQRLSKHLSNTPDLDRGKRDKDGPGYAETEYNKLHSSPPIDNHGNPSRCGPPQTPDRPESSGTPSAPPPPRAPSETSARTSSLASSNAVEDPEELPAAGTASDSPDSPTKTKPSSR